MSRLTVDWLHPLIGIAATALACQESPEAASSATIEEVLRIGAVDDSIYSFGNISHIAVDRNTNEIYVAETLPPSIKVFDGEGMFVRNIGGQGTGPGEFQRPVSLGFARGALWVVDGAQRRTTLFDRQGRLLKILVPPPRQTDIGATVSSLIPTSHNDVYFATPGGILGPQEMLWQTVDSAGTPQTTLAAVEFKERDNLSFPLTGGRLAGGRLNMSQPIIDMPIVLFDPSGSALWLINRRVGNEGGRARVLHIGLNGDTLFDRHLTFPAVEVNESLVDTLLDGIFRTYRQSPTPPPFSRSDVERHMWVPAFMPAVAMGAAAFDGSLWLGLTGYPGDTLTDWRYIDEDGRVRLRTSIPTSVRVVTGTGQELWTIARDSLDVQYVVKYKLVEVPE